MPSLKGNFYCIPKRKGSILTAAEALTEVASTARRLRQRNKTYQKRLEVRGIPPEVAEAYAYAERVSGGGVHSLTLPYAQVDLSRLSEAFISIEGEKEVESLDFIKEINGLPVPSVSAIIGVYGRSKVYSATPVRTNAAGNPLISKSGRYPYKQLTPNRLRLSSGIWLAVQEKAGGGNTFLIRANDDVSGENEVKARVDALTDSAEVRITGSVLTIDVSTAIFSKKGVKMIVGPRDNMYEGDNASKYFSYEGQGAPAPVSFSSLSVPAGILSESTFSVEVNPSEGYGPYFKGMRPPGTPSNFRLVYGSKGQYKNINVLRFFNTLIEQDINTLNAAGAQLIPQKARLPSQVIADGPILFNVVANPKLLEVPPLAYDRRPNRDNKANSSSSAPPPGTLVNDPGPFGQARGVDASGNPIIEGRVRPDGKRYDDRVGSICAVYREETTSDKLLNPPAVAQNSALVAAHTSLKSFLSSKSLEAFDYLKLLSICAYRVKGISEGVYMPYVDFCTIAMLFNIDLGVALLNAYVNDPARVTQNIVQANFITYFPPGGLQSWNSWGSTQVRDLMPAFGYETRADLPNWPSDEAATIEESHLFLPQGAPEDTTALMAYGLEFSAGAIDVVNWGDDSVVYFGRDVTGNRNLVTNLIVLHWGGSPRGFSVNDGEVPLSLSSRAGPVSTHFVVGHNGDVTQHADIGRVAFHARPYNSTSIGIDTASPGYPNRPGGFGDANLQGYQGIGYQVVECAIFNSEGGVFVGPKEMYESCYGLVDYLATQLSLVGRHEFPPRARLFSGIFTDPDGAKAVYATGGILNMSFRVPPMLPIGVIPHMYANASRTDDIVAYVYCCLRSLGDTPEEAYARLVLTLRSAVKQTQHEGKALRYLTLSRG